MATAEELAQLNRARAAVRAAAERDLKRIISGLDTTSALSMKWGLLESMPALVEKHGDIMAEVTAQWFESVIGGRVDFPGPAGAPAVMASTRNAISPLFGGGGIVPATSRLVGVVDRHVSNVSRETVARSSKASGVRYARILQGNRHCAYCVTMAGRGADYHSDTSALAASHDFCDCSVIPVRSDKDWPKGYDHARYEAMYEDAYQKADSTALKGGKKGQARTHTDEDHRSILQVMRDDYGLK